MNESEKCCSNCKYSAWVEEDSFDHYRIGPLLICKKHSTIYQDAIVREWENCEEYESDLDQKELR